MTLRIAFTGAGQMAHHHAAALRQSTTPVVPVGVHDCAANRAAELAAMLGCAPFSSIEALLADARPDIVHVCTPPLAHFHSAAAALEAGAHVYVEKPFAFTTGNARALLDAAGARGLLVCAGHQLLRDPAFETLVAAAAGLGRIVQVDSQFAFRPVAPAGAGPSTFARQLIDVLPHPLYALVSILERFAPHEPIALSWTHADVSDVHAIVRAGPIVGRLTVSLRARPIASSLTVTGTGGSLTCDFVRSIVVGAGNPGSEALEKVLNPMVEGVQLLSRTAGSLVRRLRSGTAYPGLVQLIDTFYKAAAAGGHSPVSPSHLLTVTELFEQLVARIDGARSRAPRSIPATAGGRAGSPLVLVTGARGFLGAHIVRALPRVRGVGRAGWPDDARIEQWVTADLSKETRRDLVAGVDVVVHAAAETSGGYLDHQRNTVDATRNLLNAMSESGVSRLVLISSLSVLAPPRGPWECQHEGTPRPPDPRPYGPYTWGKCLQEQLVEREAARLGIAVRIVRPGALVDWHAPELPGLMGRRLFGRWHLGIGRPGLPIAVCDVERCARAVAWCATHFESAPRVVNLFDPDIPTRGQLAARFRAAGWTGRMVWVPISALSLALIVARAGFAVSRGRLPERLAAWSILRPRRYATKVARLVLDAAEHQDPVADEVACSA